VKEQSNYSYQTQAKKCIFQSNIFQSPPEVKNIYQGKYIPTDILSAPYLDFCCQPHLQDADWSDSWSDEVQMLLQSSSSHSSSTQLPPLEVRTKSTELKQISSVKNRGKHFLVLFSGMCRCCERQP